MTNVRKPKLIPRWKQALRFSSIQLMLLLAVLNMLPLLWDALANELPVWAWAGGNVLIAVGAMYARIVLQPKLEDLGENLE